MRLLMTADAVGGVWQYALELAAALDADVTLALLGPAPDAGQRAAAAAVPGLRLVETALPLDWLASGPAEVLAAAAALARLAAEVGAVLSTCSVDGDRVDVVAQVRPAGALGRLGAASVRAAAGPVTAP